MLLFSLVKGLYKKTVDPLLALALTFERKRIQTALSERMDTLFQTMDQRQHALETDLLKVMERLDTALGTAENASKTREAVLAQRAELDDLRREVSALLERVQKARRETAA